MTPIQATAQRAALHQAKHMAIYEETSMCDQRAAMAPPPTRWERFVRWTRLDRFRWYMVPGYGITYRTAMRIGHRFNWHYMPPTYAIEGGGVMRRCHWCGVQHVMSRELEALGVAVRKGMTRELRIESTKGGSL